VQRRCNGSAQRERGEEQAIECERCTRRRRSGTHAQEKILHGEGRNDDARRQAVVCAAAPDRAEWNKHQAAIVRVGVRIQEKRQRQEQPEAGIAPVRSGRRAN
jgi:hypothetical protein